MDKKFDFKTEAKKVGAYLAQFKDVKEPILTSKIGPMLKNRVEIVYLIGLIVLAFYALVALFRFPNISAMLGGFIAVFIAFVVFRMLCEILAGSASSPKAAAVEHSEKADVKKAVKPASKKK